MMKKDVKGKNILRMKTYFFVGIGGISMSGLAQAIFSLYSPVRVFGCDRDITQQTVKNLSNVGIDVYFDDYLSCQKKLLLCLPDYIIVVDNLESLHWIHSFSLAHSIPLIKRGMLLASLVRDKKCIAVSGSHGKTTTTAMIAHIFLMAGYDPLIFIGGYMEIKKKRDNFFCGRGEWAIVEADDAFKGFLELSPMVSIITTIGYEHLETYRDFSDIQNHFFQFADNTKECGEVIFCNDDPLMESWGKKLEKKVIRYGTRLDLLGEIKAKNIQSLEKKSVFSFCKNGDEYGSVICNIPGIHNVKNALAAIEVALFAKIPFSTIVTALETFLSVERRFEYRGKIGFADCYDDYGHHPTEIECTLSVMKNLNGGRGRRFIFFQPHKYSRMKHLWNEFIRIFNEGVFDHLYITDVYSAGEKIDSLYTSKRFVEQLLSQVSNNSKKEIHYLPMEDNFTSLLAAICKLQSTVKNDDIILFLGAGIMNQLCSRAIDANKLR